jgi:hypothetical protein
MKESALIIPGLLILITFLMLLILPLQHETYRSLREFSQTKISQKLNTDTKSISLLRAFSEPSQAVLDKKLICFASNKLQAWISSNNRYCVIISGINNLSQAILLHSVATIDFDYFKRYSISCPFQLSELEPHYPLKSGYFSSFQCKFQNAILKNQIQIPANLLVGSELVLSNTPTLAVNGFVHASQINLRGISNFLLYSAGEVDISRLFSEVAATVTVISGSGNVSIKAVQENITLKVFSRGNIIIPLSSKLSSSGFESLGLEIIPLGFNL